MDQYITPSPQLPQLFHHLKSANKSLFLCTNSGFQYVNKTLSYILKIPYTYTGSHWKDIFDLSICLSSKPDFYTSQRPFRKWNFETDSPMSSPVKTFDKGGIYINGSVHTLKKVTGWEGREVLYIGDNLNADLIQVSDKKIGYTLLTVHT